MLELNISRTQDFISESEMRAIAPMVERAHKLVDERNGEGNDFLGFVELPKNFDREEFERIKLCAERIRNDSEILVVIGIGGSYLGARSAIDLLCGQFHNELGKGPKILFAGNNISASYHNDIIALCKEKDFSVNVISKSGTTTEPAIAFRIFRKLLEEKYGAEGAAKRIYCTTDKERGALKQTANNNGYETFVIPDDIGGRYSVLTPVGLLPMAVAGIDIEQVMSGAFDAMKNFSSFSMDNPTCKYAAVRNLLAGKGKTIEVFTAYEPRFAMFNEFLKQLFGESEGKDNKGIFPASMINSTDLHSMGQYIQQGRRNLYETVMRIKHDDAELIIPEDTENGDGMGFLNFRTLEFVNNKACDGTILAHCDGGVPVLSVTVDKMDAYNYGYLVYFFEKSCAISGYVSAVNPFNQPGVEGYKNNMYALLGKPGYEALADELHKRLAD